MDGVEFAAGSRNPQEIRKLSQRGIAGNDIGVGDIPAHIQQDFPAARPVELLGKVGRPRQNFLLLAVASAEGEDGGGVILLLDGYAVEFVVNGVSAKFLPGGAALLLVDLVERLLQRDNPPVVGDKFAVGAVVQVVQIPVRAASGFRREARGVGGRPAVQEPRHGVEHSGLSRAVSAVNAGAPAVEIERGVPQSLKVFQLEPLDFHALSLFSC